MFNNKIIWQRIGIVIFSSIAVFTSAAACSLPGFINNSRPVDPTLYGLIKRDSARNEGRFNRANAVRAGDQVDTAGLASLTGIKLQQIDRDNLFLLTKQKGLFQTKDGGVTWERRYIFQVDDGDQNSRDAAITRNDAFIVRDFVVDVRNPKNIQIAGKTADNIGKIYQSTDEGATFSEIYSEIEKNVGVNLITIDPANPFRIYAVLERGALIRSLDRGVTWRKVQSFQSIPIQLGFVPEFGNIFFVLLPNTGLSISTDNGDNWENKPLFKSTSTVGESQNRDTFQINPFDKNETFGVHNKLIPVIQTGRRYNPDNQSWLLLADRQIWLAENLNSKFGKLVLPLQSEQYNISDITFDPKLGLDRIWVSLDSRLFQTNNRGQSWNVQDSIRVSDKIGSIGQILIDRDNNEIMYLMLVNPTSERKGNNFF